MTQTLDRIQNRLNTEAVRHTIEVRTFLAQSYTARQSKSGRTCIWHMSANTVVFCFTRDDGTFKYRECSIGGER